MRSKDISRNLPPYIVELVEMLSTKTAQEWRLRGNEFFQQKKYQAALGCYTQSVLAASKARSTESATTDDLPLAYANRSAALYHMDNYKVCLQDIGLALDHGYPKHLQYKLHQRKGLCLLHLGKFEEADMDLKNAVKLIETLPNIDKRKRASLKAEVEKHMEECQQRNVDSSDHQASSRKEDRFITSESIANASNSVCLRYNSSKGRHLVANSLITAGSVVIKEMPYASVLLPDYYESHCHFCYKQLVAPVPCSKCSWVMYCSKSCLQAAWEEHHSIECSHWKLLQQLGTFACLSLRIAARARKESPCVQGHSDQIGQGCEADGTYKAGYHAICCLMPHTNNHSKQELLSYQQKATTLSKCLASHFLVSEEDRKPSLKQIPTQDINLHLSSLKVGSYLCEEDVNSSLLNQELHNATIEKAQQTADSQCGVDIQSTHHDQKIKKDHTKGCTDTKKSGFDKAFDAVESIQSESDTDIKILIEKLTLHMKQLKCNAHAITAVRVVPQGCGEGRRNVSRIVDSTEQVRIATAVYPTASLMNHSCEPNVIASFEGRQLTVRAIKDIEKDEEIFHCYGPHAKHMDTGDRLKVLQEQYFFTCHCTACETDSSKLSKQNACNWSTAFRCPECGEPVTRIERVEVSVLKCRQCQRDINFESLEKQAAKAASMFAEAVENLHQNEFKKCLALLKQCCNIRTRVLYKQHKDIAETQDCIARCYASIGDFKEAGKYLKASIAIVARNYGESSIEVANELHKMAQIFFNRREVSKALDTIEKALQLFTMHYGDKHESLEELQQMKTCLLTM